MNIIKNTQSICPECLKILPATVFERDDKVWIKKECPEHGEFEELYWGDYKLYQKAVKFAHDGKGVTNPNLETSQQCPKNCGLCNMHLSHTALGNVVVTNRCDLQCFYCLPYDEEIIIKMDNQITLNKIGEIVEEAFNFADVFPMQNGEYVVPQDLEVITFQDKKCIWTKVKKLFRRKFKGNFYKIKTKTGKEIKVTEDHRFLIFSENKLIRKVARDLRADDKIISLWNLTLTNETDDEINLFDAFKILPNEEKNKIYIRGIKNYLNSLVSEHGTLKNVFNDGGIVSPSIYNWRIRDSMPLSFFYRIAKGNLPETTCFGLDAVNYTLPLRFKITTELVKLIGYFIADGHYTKHNLRITSEDSEKRKEIEYCLNKLNIRYSILDLTKFKKAQQIVIGNKLLMLIFKYVFNIPPFSSHKRLPNVVLNFPLELKLALLSGLFNGDGYVMRGQRHCSIGIATVSKGLARDIVYLLMSLGIFCRIHFRAKEKMKGARHDLYKIYVSSQDMLKLVSLLDLKQNHLNKLQNLTERKKSVIEKFGDFVVDEIKKIEKVGIGSDYVYDLEVENDSHSFIGGDGILISNCFFYAKAMGYVYDPSLGQIRMMLRAMRREEPVRANAVQLTGGEPCIREDIVDIIRIAKEEGYDHIQLNTNGIRFSQNPEFAKKVRNAGVNTIYLSFDGTTPETNPKNHWEIPRILNNCRKADIGTVLVPTVINTVNDHDVGNILRFGVKNAGVVRGVNYQPVSLVGRITNVDRKKFRITIPDVIKKIEEQTDGAVSREHWYPVPTVTPITHFFEALTDRPRYELTAHPACGMATYLFIDNSKIVPLPEFFDVEGFLEFLEDLVGQIKGLTGKIYTSMKILSKLNSFIDKDKQPKDLNFGNLLFNILRTGDYKTLGELHHKSLFIGMMHFMDLYNYDIERVKRCCIHYAQPDGRIVPFCAFNVIPQWYRDKIQEEYSLSIPEWEKKVGRKLETDFYKRNIKELEADPLYKRTYEGFVKAS